MADRGSRLPLNWKPDNDSWNYATSFGFSADQVEGIVLNFVEYWANIPGHRGLKLNWDLAWRTWIRREAERGPRAQRRNGTIFDLQMELEER